jgi:ABC-type antimicrobial peptide transport system permease subunit
MIESHLHGIRSTDIWSFAAGTSLLILAALAASFVPSWRAARMDPSRALHEE